MRTADYGFELVKQLCGVSLEAMAQKNRLEVELAKIDNEVHRKQLAICKHFVQDVAEGRKHVLQQREDGETATKSVKGA